MIRWPLCRDVPFKVRAASPWLALTVSQKVALAIEIEPFFAKEAEKRLHLSKGRGIKGQGHVPLPLKSEQSRDLAAAAVGLSGKTVSQAKAIKAASPERFEKIKQGSMTVAAATSRWRHAVSWRRSWPRRSGQRPGRIKRCVKGSSEEQTSPPILAKLLTPASKLQRKPVSVTGRNTDTAMTATSRATILG